MLTQLLNIMKKNLVQLSKKGQDVGTDNAVIGQLIEMGIDPT